MERAFGPWLVDTVLGRGGMGVVWRARHREDGRLAAVKTVELDSPALLAGFRREIAALARLSHPGIVRLLDHGVEDGLPWFAMELVDGVPLLVGSGSDTSLIPEGPSTFVDDGDDGPAVTIPLDGSALRALRRLCDALAALHGAGLVHRDLKPGNVLVTAGGAPMLVDFGLAVTSRRREVLDVVREVAGTRGYMAPEQLRGEAVDARADLYALGRMIEDASSGRADLRPLIAALVTEDPRDRIGHTDEIAAALDAALGADGPPLVSPPILYRPALAGRARERAAIEEALRSAGVTIVTGEPGSGKTRLIAEILRPLARSGTTVVSAVPLAPAGGRVEQFAAAEASLAALGPRVVLVLDDLQWADELTVAFVAHLTTRPTPLPVLATVRPGEADDAVRRLLQGGAARVIALGPLEPEHVRAIAQDMLATREIPALLAPALASAAGSPLWVGEILRTALDEGWLVREGGRWRLDAFPACEDVRGWATRRVAALPPAVREALAGAAIAGRTVDPDVLARMGIDAGDAVREGVRRQILEDVGDRLLFAHDALRDAAAASLGPDAKRTLSARAAEALGDADPARVAGLWAQAGETDRALPLLDEAAGAAVRRGAPSEAEAAWRTWLRLAGPDHPRRAVVMHDLAWDVLRRTGRNDEALDLAAASLPLAEAAGDADLVLRALTTLGACYLNLGRPEAALDRFETAAARATAPIKVAQAYTNMGLALEALGRPREARVAYERTVELLEASGERRVMGMAVLKLADAEKIDRRLPEARQRYHEALALLREFGHRRFEGVALGNLGDLELLAGRLDEAAPILDAALIVKREIGDRRGEAYTIATLSVLRARQGELAEARRLNDVARALSIEVGDERHLAEVELDRARLEREAGDPDAACRWLDVASSRAAPDPQFRGIVAAERARVARARGEDPGPWLAAARTIAEQHGLTEGDLADAIRAAE
jgi:serine/threonine protein kinase/tetratricopeptide (TPR) repeat protein